MVLFNSLGGALSIPRPSIPLCLSPDAVTLQSPEQAETGQISGYPLRTIIDKANMVPRLFDCSCNHLCLPLSVNRHTQESGFMIHPSLLLRHFKAWVLDGSLEHKTGQLSGGLDSTTQ